MIPRIVPFRNFSSFARCAKPKILAATDFSNKYLETLVDIQTLTKTINPFLDDLDIFTTKQHLQIMSPREMSELCRTALSESGTKGLIISGCVFRTPDFLWKEQAEIPKILDEDSALSMMKMQFIKESLLKREPVIGICDGAYPITALMNERSEDSLEGNIHNLRDHTVLMEDGFLFDAIKKNPKYSHLNHIEVAPVLSTHSLNPRIIESSDVKVLAHNNMHQHPAIVSFNDDTAMAIFDHLEAYYHDEVEGYNYDIKPQEVWKVICHDFADKVQSQETPNSTTSPKLNARLLHILEAGSMAELSAKNYTMR